jgi:hypothetical protein
MFTFSKRRVAVSWSYCAVRESFFRKSVNSWKEVLSVISNRFSYVKKHSQ